MIRAVTGTEQNDRRQKGNKEDRDRNAEGGNTPASTYKVRKIYWYLGSNKINFY